MKCTSCGHNKLYRTNIIETSEGYTTVDVFACEKCGHIEMFEKQEKLQSTVQKIRTEEKFNEEKEKKLMQLKTEYNKVQKEIERLEKIVSDEDLAVKVVKQAQTDLEQYRQQLNKLQIEIKQVERSKAFPTRMDFLGL